MKIEILINSEHPDAAAIQAELSGELAAFNLRDHGITITTKTAPPPPNTLGVAEVYQFIIEHADDAANLALILKAILDVVSAVLRRRNISPIQAPKALKTTTTPKKTKPKTSSPKQQPTIIIKVGDTTLSIPSTSTKEHSFIIEVTNPKPTSKKKS
jgi:hypothetical protein